ncbi:MAG: hypothetical protein ACP5TE_04480 [Verrucomicrobiia bacterium]
MKKIKHIIKVNIMAFIIAVPLTGFCGYIWMSKCNMFEDYVSQDKCGSDCTGTCIYIDVQGTGGECVEASFYDWCTTVDQFYVPYEVQERECIMQGEYPSTRCIPSSIILNIIERHENENGYLCNCSN